MAASLTEAPFGVVDNDVHGNFSGSVDVAWNRYCMERAIACA